jgi:hypothetical protein
MEKVLNLHRINIFSISSFVLEEKTTDRNGFVLQNGRWEPCFDVVCM